MNTLLQKKKGFFLIEVLYLALIVTIIAVPLIYSLNTILRAFKVSNDFTKSIYLAESVLFKEIKQPGSVDALGDFPKPNDKFRWELERTPLPGEPGINKVRVKVKDHSRLYAELVTIVKKK